MKLKKKTLLNILLIAFVLSFFVTPLGFYGKVLLHRLFAPRPTVIVESKREKIADYDWRLKDADWNFFNFKQSEGKVVFINLWASWKLPSYAELTSIQKLYDAYGDKVDFYIITNELREPVETFMEKHGFTFPVTYLIIGDKMPIDSKVVPSSYLIDKEGSVVVYEKEIASWNRGRVHKLLDELISK
ncbi:thiol-disulfide isomerase/thioredoxin [Saonia flava]|uniref:Thiol-disulfide isomerase/thioredoxin n=1 Tax=Saonia flava TaxID=523696 RepID=A0A846R156_9FLAO|nr:TlpA disulfide reductase family protein [Saonia flava]NJB70589.1 thiol-disulfide isomerase/thioredoxin [Saonia flava]